MLTWNVEIALLLDAPRQGNIIRSDTDMPNSSSTSTNIMLEFVTAIR